ncbi:MAG: hypothetical protein M9918_24660 [Anaerolineae bacterium]|nr:hypothetical protein [Anaerolineae bacterium]
MSRPNLPPLTVRSHLDALLDIYAAVGNRPLTVTVGGSGRFWEETDDGNIILHLPDSAEPPDLVQPSVKISAIENAILYSLPDLLDNLVEERSDTDKAIRILHIIEWAIRYRAAAAAHGGLVPRDIDANAVDQLVDAINLLFATPTEAAT